VTTQFKENQYTIFGVILSFPFILFCTLLESYLKLKSFTIPDLIHIQTISPLLWLIDSAPIALGFFGWIVDFNQKKNRLITAKLEEANHTLQREIIKSTAMENHLRDMIDMYESDLHSAKVIQEYALPEIPELVGINMNFRFRPLYTIGGDFLSLHQLEGGEVSILVGDVVGHGISAALITSLVHVLSNKTRKNFGTEPKNYLEHLNEEVSSYLPDDYYLTALYGLLHVDHQKMRFQFSRAGHPNPFLYRAAEKSTMVQELTGIPLGLQENKDYSELVFEINSGDRIYLITDGLLEVRDKNGTLFGLDGVSQVINDANHQNLSLDASLDFILDAVKSYTDEKAFIDDTLILGIEIL
jgi:sigma-B regulation protein RsbU (phosphoserine phosphatase)